MNPRTKFNSAVPPWFRHSLPSSSQSNAFGPALFSEIVSFLTEKKNLYLLYLNLTKIARHSTNF